MRYYVLLGLTVLSIGFGYAYGPNIYRHVTMDQHAPSTPLASVPDKPMIMIERPQSLNDPRMGNDRDSLEMSPSLQVIHSGLLGLQKPSQISGADQEQKNHVAQNNVHPLKKNTSSKAFSSSAQTKNLKKISSRLPKTPRFLSQEKSSRPPKDTRLAQKEARKKEAQGKDLSCHMIASKTPGTQEKSRFKQKKNLHLTTFSKK